MSYYIYLDGSGKEIKRENKGQGRPKRGSQQKEDGNFYITVDGSETVAPVTAPVAPAVAEVKDLSPIPITVAPKATNGSKAKVVETVTDENGVEEIIDSGEEHFKVRKTNKKVTLKHFLSCCLGLPRTPVQDKHTVTILRPSMVGELGLDETIKSNGVYGKILLNLTENIIYVWNTQWEGGRPDFIVKDALELKSDLVEENL